MGIDSAPQAVLISYSGAAAGVNLTVNGGYSPAGVSGVLDTNLNYGVRVSSRPVLPYGDVGVVASPSGPSYECMLGNGWNTIGGPSVPFDYPTITAPLRLTGSYQLEVTLLDACAQGTAMSSQLNVTACVDTVSNIQPGDSVNSVIWQDHAFPFFDFQQVKNAPVSVTVYYSWFLTAGPAGVLVYNTTAGNAPTISPNATTCLAFPPTGGFPAAAGSYGAQIGVDGLSGIAVLRQVNPLDPYAPIQNSVTASTLSYQPLYTGSYSFTLQAIGPCDLKYFTLSG